VLYVVYYLLWVTVYLFYFDKSLLAFKHYKYAPYFLTITFILPITFKLIYNQETVKDFLIYLEWMGYFAATIIFISLLFGVTSKETGDGYEIVNLSEALRYAPIRGYFSLRQADLLSASVIICVSGYMSNTLDNKKIIVRLPFAVLCLFGIIISGTRGSFILLCLLCVHLITKSNLKKRVCTVIAAVIIGMFLLSFYLMPSYRHLFFRVFQPTYYTRGETSISAKVDGYYNIGIRNFLKRPILGNGMSKVGHDYNYSHSIIISVLEDTGIIGLFIMSLIIICILHKCTWFYKKEAFKDGQLPLRTLIIFHFLSANLHGTIAMHYCLFFMIYIYYFAYKREEPSFKSTFLFEKASEKLC
ncbi:MAG: O-antigen ligase family protein, partial [Planctomycetota bacterium]